MKKYTHHSLKGDLILIKKWSKNGIEKCKVDNEDGYEHIVDSENLKEIKTKSNKKKKK